MVLDLVKNSLGIPLDSHELDAELNAFIEARSYLGAVELMRSILLMKLTPW